MGCCGSKDGDDSNSEDPELNFRVPEGLPEPGPPPPAPENPLTAPNHISVYHNTENTLEGKDELPELELSPVSDHFI